MKKELFGNDNELLKEVLNIINENSENNISTNFNDFNIETVLLKEVISEDDYMLVESDNLLQKEVVLLNRDDVNQNICYKALIDKIRVIKEENEKSEKQTTINDDLNSHENQNNIHLSRPSTSQNSSNGQGNIQSGIQSRPQIPVGSENPPTGSGEPPMGSEEPVIDSGSASTELEKPISSFEEKPSSSEEL